MAITQLDSISTSLSGPRSVFVCGNYAYVASSGNHSLSIFDISDSESIVTEGSISGGAPNYLYGCNDVKVIGNYAYVVSGSSDSLGIYDISTPSTPILKDVIWGAGSPNYLNGAYALDVVGDYAYVVSIDDDAFSIFDVSDVTNIVLKGTIRGGGAPNYLNGCKDIKVSGNYAYIVSPYDDAISIFDVSDVTNIVLKGSFTGSGFPTWHFYSPNKIEISGNYAYIVCPANSNTLYIFDISDPTNPNEVGSIGGCGSPNYLCDAYSVEKSADYCLVGSVVDKRLTVINVSDPTTPTFEETFYSTSTLGNPMSVFAKGTVAYVISYTNNTLSTFDISDYAGYIISGTVTKGDGSTLSGATIRVTNTTNDEYTDDTSDANGAYSVDLTNLTSGFSDGDGVKVRCYSTYKTTTVDTINFPAGRIINLTCFGRFQIDNVDITGIINNKVSKTIGQAAWNSETLLENKNGYRSTNYQSFQPVQIDIDGITLLKGRIRDIDLNTNHLLKISGENYSSLLNDAYITDQQAAGSTFSNKSIYYAITDSSDGIIPNYASSVTTTNVVNDANTQQTFTKTFNKESISSALMWLGELASSIGYIFYVDNNKDLHFEERRTIDTELTLVNTGSRKCVMGWEWRNSSGKDIYNRIRVIGSGVDVTRNDISSQTEFGIREHPTITDNNITIVADANTVGDNLLSRYANPFKEVVLKCKTNADVADSVFPLLFTSYFGGYKGLLYLEPGDLIRTDISGIGIPQSNIFPWTFSTDFTPEKRIVLSIEHQFPQYITTLKLSEYYKDLSTLIASNVKGEIK